MSEVLVGFSRSGARRREGQSPRPTEADGSAGQQHVAVIVEKDVRRQLAVLGRRLLFLAALGSTDWAVAGPLAAGGLAGWLG